MGYQQKRSSSIHRPDSVIPSHSLGRATLQNFLRVSLATVASLVLTACAQDRPALIQLADQDGIVLDSWEDAFSGGRLIDIDLPPSAPQILQAIDLLITPHSNRLVLPDPRNQRILIFDHSGLDVRIVGKGGIEAGAFAMLRTVTVAPTGGIWAFDQKERQLNLFTDPSFSLERQINLPSSAAQILVRPDGGFLIYSPTSKKVLQVYSNNGKLVRKTLKPVPEDSRLFLARIQSGGIAPDHDQGHYAIYPTDFRILHYSDNLRLTEVLVGDPAREWQPSMPPFPERLSPYDYQPAHEKWWSSFAHIGKIFLVDQDTLLVSIYKSSGIHPEHWFANLYSTDGEMLAEGLAVPHSGQIIGASQGKLYVARQASLSTSGEHDPFELYEYRLSSQLSRLR